MTPFPEIRKSLDSTVSTQLPKLSLTLGLFVILIFDREGNVKGCRKDLLFLLKTHGGS